MRGEFGEEVGDPWFGFILDDEAYFNFLESFVVVVVVIVVVVVLEDFVEWVRDLDADGTGGCLFGNAREGELYLDGLIVSEEGGGGFVLFVVVLHECVHGLGEESGVDHACHGFFGRFGHHILSFLFLFCLF